MRTRDLFELAALDVLGLLDEEERQDFENAFRAATPEVQAQIRREQRRQAAIEDWLPEVEPPAGLRARVISAVRDAISSMNEPVATIGPRQNGTPWFNSVAVWRAACIGFATASVILAGFFYGTQSQLKDIDSVTRNDTALQEFQRKYGARFHSVMASPKTQRVRFAPAVSTTGKFSAVLHIDPDTNEAFLMGDHMPIASGQYRLVVKSVEDGRFTQLQEIPGNGGQIWLHIESITADDARNLAIVKPGGAEVEDVLLHVEDNA